MPLDEHYYWWMRCVVEVKSTSWPKIILSRGEEEEENKWSRGRR